MQTNTKTAILTAWHVAVCLVAVYGAYIFAQSHNIVLGAGVGLLAAFTAFLWLMFLKTALQEPGGGR